MVDDRYTHSALTEKVIGCAMRVHSELGNGFPESVYQRSLAVELEAAGLSFQRELHRPVYYKQVEVGARRVDFLVADVLLIELKATTEMNDLQYAQIINYLKAYRLEVGLLLNFGQKSLQYKRFVKTQPAQ